MAGKAGEAFVEIVPQMAGFGQKLSAGVQKEAASSSQKIGASMTKVGAGMTAGLTLPIVAGFASATKAYQESAAVQAQTQAAIKSTGGEAGVTAKEVSNLASAISNYAAVDDEAIQAGENMLLTFTNIRNEAGKGNAIFDRTSKIMADVAQATGTDAKSAALQLGKALNDPAAGLSKLTRIGVTFSDSQKKAVERMVETGDTAGAQKVILDELAKEFGGSAKAFGDSAAGESQKASIAFGNAMEDMGKALQPFVSAIADTVGKLAGWFSGLSGPAKTIIVVILGIVAALGPLLVILGTIISIAPAIGSAVSVMFGPWGLIIAAIVVAVIALVYVIKRNWTTIKKVTFAVWNAIKGFVVPLWKAIVATAKFVWNLLVGIFKVAFAVIKGYVLVYWTAIKFLIVKPLLWVWDQVKKILGWISEKWSAVWDGIKRGVSGIWDGIVAGVKLGANFLLGVIEKAVNAFLEPFQKLSTAPVVGAAIPDIPEISIPRLASGGIVTRPTLAVIGEAGPEAVVPLGRHGFGGVGGRQIAGVLTLTPESKAYVRGVIVEEDVATLRHARTLDRMRGGRT